MDRFKLEVEEIDALVIKELGTKERLEISPTWGTSYLNPRNLKEETPIIITLTDDDARETFEIALSLDQIDELSSYLMSISMSMKSEQIKRKLEFDYKIEELENKFRLIEKELEDLKLH